MDKDVWVSRGKIWVNCPDGKQRKRHKAKISDITTGNLALILYHYAYPLMINVLTEDTRDKVLRIQLEYMRRKEAEWKTSRQK